MTINLTLKHLILAVIIVFVLILTRTSARPYLNNQWKPHRWASESCVKVGKPATACSLAVHGEGTETAYFDICLEHGELKRIK